MNKLRSKKSRTPTPADALRAAAECLKSLAHPQRLRIIQLLLQGRYTVGELAEKCEISSHIASGHLRLLQRCGFLTAEKEGRSTFYRVIEPHLKQLMKCIESRFGAEARH